MSFIIIYALNMAIRKLYSVLSDNEIIWKLYEERLIFCLQKTLLKQRPNVFYSVNIIFTFKIVVLDYVKIKPFKIHLFP